MRYLVCKMRWKTAVIIAVTRSI